jgi:hypothetical protein
MKTVITPATIESLGGICIRLGTTMQELKEQLKSVGDPWIRLAVREEIKRLRREQSKHDRHLTA